MLCPKCQTEVTNWQFYCPLCQTALQDYQDFGRSSRQQTFDRVGANLVNLIIVLLLAGGSVIVARQIDWKELIAMFKDPGAGLKNEAPRRVPDNSRPKDRRRRVKPKSDASKSTGEAAQTASVESVRRLPNKIEELPSPDGVEGAFSRTQQEKRPLTPAENPLMSGPDLSNRGGDEQEAVLSIESANSSADAGQGFITIQSYTRARIYVDGQYSGMTPRTVRLASGGHQIRLIAEGYIDWTRNVELKSRQQIGIMASMKKKL